MGGFNGFGAAPAAVGFGAAPTAAGFSAAPAAGGFVGFLAPAAGGAGGFGGFVAPAAAAAGFGAASAQDIQSMKCDKCATEIQ